MLGNIGFYKESARNRAMTDDDKSRLIEKQDVKNLAILIGIALAIGVYLTVTTVLISKDGVFYIERAQQLESDAVNIIKSHPPGFPFLILAARNCADLFTDDSSVFSWIYAAQSVTLLCRLLALISLYLIGKMFVGSRESFWAILILIILPYPAKMASEVIREWPHLLFLASGLLALLYGAKSGKWWMFGVAGFVAGLGHMVRFECAQVVIYGVIWLAIDMFRRCFDAGKRKNIFLIGILLTGFAVPAIPYMAIRGEIFPAQLRNAFSINSQSQTPDDFVSVPITETANIASGTSKILKAFAKLFNRIAENLMYFFTLPLIFGLYKAFHKRRKIFCYKEFFVMAFICLNTLMMILLFLNHGHMSRRHTFPLVAMTVFYIPAGLNVMAKWWCGRTKKNTDADVSRMFFILLAVGVGICLPKLLGNSSDKEGYLAAADWIGANTAEDAVIAVPDSRISFYAEREGLYLESLKEKKGGDYYVEIVEGDEKGGEVSYWVDEDRKKKKVVVCRNSEK